MSAADKFMERRAALAKQMQDLAGKAIDENRNLSAEEQQTFERMNAEVDELAKRADAILEGERNAKDLEESYRKVHGDAPGEQRATGGGELGKWARESRAGDAYDMAIEARAMGLGGLAPAGAHNTLWEYAVEASELLAYVTLMTTADGNTVPMPVATVHAEPGAADIAASGVVPDDDSTLDTVDLAVAKRGFKTAVPNELLQDATFDVEGYISRNAGRALGNAVAAAGAAAAIAGFTVAGATTPGGVLTNLGDQSLEGQGSDLLVDLFHSVIAPYRSSAGVAFGMSDSAAAIVRKLKTTDGAPVWQPSLTAGNPDLVLGKPVAVVPQFDAFAASAKPIWFGDWKALVVRIAGGLRFERSAEAGFDNDQTVFRALVRRGAVALDPNAVKYLAVAAI